MIDETARLSSFIISYEVNSLAVFRHYRDLRV